MGFLLEISLLGRLRLLYVVTTLGIDFCYIFHASVTILASLLLLTRCLVAALVFAVHGGDWAVSQSDGDHGDGARSAPKRNFGGALQW